MVKSIIIVVEDTKKRHLARPRKHVSLMELVKLWILQRLFTYILASFAISISKKIELQIFAFAKHFIIQ